MTQMHESFRWFRNDFKKTSQVGKAIRIKGVALYPTVSKNNREYIEDELLRSARTLANQPIDVNHEYDLWKAKMELAKENGESFNDPKPTFKGNVLDADFEDGRIEYVAEINHPEYVAKLKDREQVESGKMTLEQYRDKWEKDPIHGVSISANYRFAENKADPDQPAKPLGIQFVRLSLVEDPETPGVEGTTIELMETAKANERSKAEVIVVGTILRDIAPKVYETYDAEVLSKMLDDEERDTYKLEQTFSDGDPRNIHESGGLELPDEQGKPEIGEPMGDYKDFADCVAKNQDKDDPEAYCGSIKDKVEGETEEQAGDPIEKVEVESTEDISIPEIKETADTEEDTIEKLKLELSQKDKKQDTRIDTIIETMQNMAQKLNKDSKKASEVLIKLSDNDVKLQTATKGFQNTVAQIKKLKADREEVKEVSDKAEQMGEDVSNLTDSMVEASTAVAEVTEMVKVIKTGFNEMNESLSEMGERLTLMESRLNTGLSQLEDFEALRTTIEGSNAEMKQALDDGLDTLSQLKEGYDALSEQLKEDKTLRETEGESLESFKEEMKERLEKSDEKFEAIEMAMKPNFKAPEEAPKDEDGAVASDYEKDPTMG